jgi:hypothetical protein
VVRQGNVGGEFLEIHCKFQSQALYEALERSILDIGLRLHLCALATAPRRFTLIGNGALRTKNNVQRLEPKQLDLPVFEAFSPDFGGPEALTSLSINLLSLVIR